MNAIEKVKGPCVVFAGAGTGKTYTIVEKIKYLIKNKICSPEKIVCLTFSNEAANSLFSRAGRALNLEIGKEPIIKVRSFGMPEAKKMEKELRLIFTM